MSHCIICTGAVWAPTPIRERAPENPQAPTSPNSKRRASCVRGWPGRKSAEAQEVEGRSHGFGCACAARAARKGNRGTATGKCTGISGSYGSLHLREMGTCFGPPFFQAVVGESFRRNQAQLVSLIVVIDTPKPLQQIHQTPSFPLSPGNSENLVRNMLVLLPSDLNNGLTSASSCSSLAGCCVVFVQHTSWHVSIDHSPAPTQH